MSSLTQTSSLLCLLLLHLLTSTSTAAATHKTYIVQIDPKYGFTQSSLESISTNILYTYRNVFHGYSTKLTPSQATTLEKHPAVISILPDSIFKLHTTRTPYFLGLQTPSAASTLPDSRSVSDVIIGILDTGIWPENPSFHDHGLGPVPSSWKGSCDEPHFCNRKLIGARFFSKGYESATGPVNVTVESKSSRDDIGHGSHTASTAAGSTVYNASFYEYGEGTARGAAPDARVAAYKVCWLNGCFSSDILAGIDQAVEDGVHILSLSIGGQATHFYKDTIAIATFAAAQRGILISCSAGNGGPNPSSVSNVAPWITTVAAGTLDRQFPAFVTLGNGKNFTGASLYSGNLLTVAVQLVYAGNASSTGGSQCSTGSLIPEEVRGKIVLCERGGQFARIQKGVTVKNAGGVGMILANMDIHGEDLITDPYLYPSVAVGYKTGKLIKDYISSDENPMASLVYGITQLGVQPSPVIAAFSSRGPNQVVPEILKPDLSAPGVSILAAWSGAAGPTDLAIDTRRVNFNIISGTSMSCPHVTGLSALVKAAHPEWSPAAIRSALMTTAYTIYKSGEAILDGSTRTSATPFDYGAGHVDPVRAIDPGLIYDITPDDYLDFLCALNYTWAQFKAVSKQDLNCSSRKMYSVGDLNYPSFSVSLQTGLDSGNEGDKSIVRHTRILRNVGSPGSYKATLSKVPKDVKVLVQPDELTFEEIDESKGYTVTFTASSQPSGTASFGALEWSDGKHVVSSQIAITWT